MRSLIPVFLLITVCGFGQLPFHSGTEANRLAKMLVQYHVEPKKLDDELSRTLFHTLLNHLDEERLHFTQAELQKLRLYELQLDNELNGGGWKFLPLLIETYGAAVKRSAALVAGLSAQPIDVRRISIGSVDTVWATTDAEIQQRWQNVLHTEVIAELANKRMTEATTTEDDFIRLWEPLSRLKVKLVHERRLRKISGTKAALEKHVTTVFLRAVAMVFDPHSLYFSPTQMEHLMGALSTEGYQLGIDLKVSDRGEILVAGLLPGGPAWRSGRISNGDRIEKIRWDGHEWIDITGMDEAELSETMMEYNHTFLELMLRSSTGSMKLVRLQKEKMVSDEVVVRAFLLEGKRKIGYISLPDFYSSWGAEGAKCANDVAKEILKLKKENIEGLILDLRFNGGGSMNEAVQMAGIFIDAGPVAIEKQRDKELFTLRDLNRGTVYDGPLVVMVNGLSASASEFVAAALQDHRRAIIVGSPTYGKGVSQTIFSLETGKPVSDFTKLNTKKPWGYATITTSRLYRVSGKSFQQTGVIPDIRLPDVYDVLDDREERLPFALKQDSVVKKTYLQQLPLIPFPELQEKSQTRIAAHTGFNGIRTFIDHIPNTQERASLNWTTMKNKMEAREKAYRHLESALAGSAGSFDVNLHEFGKPRMQFDEYAESVNRDWIENLSHDITLQETFHVICDYIETLQRNR
jgi:carboxyl-terminal processing protease